MSWLSYVSPKLDDSLSRILNGRYHELEARAQAFRDYVKDNTKSGLEDHQKTVDKILDASEGLIKHIQNFRKSKDWVTKVEESHSAIRHSQVIHHDISKLEEGVPAENNSRPFQIAGYRQQFNLFQEELTKRKPDFKKDIETAQDVAGLTQLR